MEMLPPAPSVVVGAAVVKRFPGYGVHRGTIEEINGGKVVVHWAATDERTTLSLKEAAKRVIASPPVADEDDERASTTALVAQVPRIALEELARRMLENPGSARNANGHGRRSQKRRRDEPAATAPSARQRN